MRDTLPSCPRSTSPAIRGRPSRPWPPERVRKPATLAISRLTDPGDTSTYESVQGWRDNVIDVGRDASYEFLDVVIGELADMYRRAGVPLEYVHLGGDEVPKGAWEASPACRAIPTPNPKLSRGQQLEIYFLKRACGIVEKHDATPACWDDCLLFAAADTDWPQRPLAYVWNNVWGWGREDAAYRLANAGFDVVLANATNLYFDLATEKDPLEPGYYWAGFVDMRAPFEFNPFDFYQNARAQLDGASRWQPINSPRVTRLTSCRTQAHSRHPRPALG